MGNEKSGTNSRRIFRHNKRANMNRKEIDLLLSRMEGLKSFLENNSLERFQQEILRVENFLKRFGSLSELLSHLENVEKIAYLAKDFLSIDEVAAYLQVSKSYVYKLTMQKEFTVYKPKCRRPLCKQGSQPNRETFIRFEGFVTKQSQISISQV